MLLKFALAICLAALSFQTVIRVSSVDDCPTCGCPNLYAANFADVNYTTQFQDVELLLNSTVFLQTTNWYIAVHNVSWNNESLSVCYSLVYTYDGSNQPLSDAMRICMDLDTLYYDVNARVIRDPKELPRGVPGGDIFVLYNPNRDNPLVMGCDYCNIALQSVYVCQTS
jgi:hypothetical protein